MKIDTENAYDLMASFEDHYELIQKSINQLINNTDDKELINTAFRSVHTLKGNASMFNLTPLVEYIHSLEETISALRSDHFKPTQSLCDLILAAVDQMKYLHIKYIFGTEVAPIDEISIKEILGAIANTSNASEVEKLCHKLSIVFSPMTSTEAEMHEKGQMKDKEELITVDTLSDHRSYLQLEGKQEEDLALFRKLSQQVDDQNLFWAERTDLLLFLALKTVALADKYIDTTQLVAAVYMHDVGMAFIPEDILRKDHKLNSMEVRKLQQHPVWGYDILRRMSGWEPAADMVLSHHERIDGEGYPHKIKGDQLNEGAKLLAIIDAFYAMTHLRADRSHRRSFLRAMSEMNACIGTQFDAYWVGLFNCIIRGEVKAGTVALPCVV